MHKYLSGVVFNDNEWENPAHFPDLCANEVHIWRADLLERSKQVESFMNVLSTAEKERANRFHFKKDREQFIVAKGISRLLLSNYIPSSAKEITFEFNAYGKPCLTGSHPLQFNISHAGGLGLFAFVLTSPIGVDIEKIKQDIEIQKIAKRFFSIAETNKILNLPKPQQVDAFFNCWTRKEAFIKAHGEGLSLPLSEFEVSILDTERVKILAINWASTEVNHWNLLKISPKKTWKAAVAVKGNVKKISLFSF